MTMEIRTINEKYSVSDTGEVFGPSGRPLKQQVTDRGYRTVALGYGKGKRVHRLVAEAFIPNPGALPEVNHKDGDKGHNHVANLEWVTHRQNMGHAYGRGLIVNPSGEGARRAILTQEEVDMIRASYIPRDPKFGQAALGRRYGVTNSCIFRVVHDLTWRG